MLLHMELWLCIGQLNSFISMPTASCSYSPTINGFLQQNWKRAKENFGTIEFVAVSGGEMHVIFEAFCRRYAEWTILLCNPLVVRCVLYYDV